MKGSIDRRGKNAWRIRVDVGVDPATNKRKIQTITVRGKRADADLKLAETLAALGNGSFVEPRKLTVADHMRDRLKQWMASGEITPKTAERYASLIENQIVPYLGATKLQKLRTIDVENWHTTLRATGAKRGGPLAARTIGHAHRVLGKGLREAVKHGLVARNVAGRDGQRAPKVEKTEVEIIPADKIGIVVEKLRCRAIYPKAVTALFTGLRRGELLGLRWCNVDLVGKVLRVRQAVEETKAGLRIKAAKTEAGRRDISLPDIVADTLTDHRREQRELRLAMGLGKAADDALVFPDLEGGPARPSNLSGDWREAVDALDLPDVTWHALRHTHASQLIDAGVDVVRISKRLGHADPAITLRIYAHLFESHDAESAAAINAAFPGKTRT